MENRQNDLQEQIRSFVNALSKSSKLPLSGIYDAVEFFVTQARIKDATAIAAQETRQVIPGSEYAVIFHGYHINNGSGAGHVFGYPVNYQTTVALKNSDFFKVLEHNKFNGVLVPEHGEPLPPHRRADFVPGFQSYGCPGLVITNDMMNLLASPTADTPPMNMEMAFPRPNAVESWDQHNIDPFLLEGFPQQNYIAPPGQSVASGWNQPNYFDPAEPFIAQAHEPLSHAHFFQGNAPGIENNIAAAIEQAQEQPAPSRRRRFRQGTMQCPECFKPYKQLKSFKAHLGKHGRKYSGRADYSIRRGVQAMWHSRHQ